MSKSSSQVQLQIIELSDGQQFYQTLALNLLKPQVLIDVQELLSLELPSELDFNQPVILYGKAPNWLYCYLSQRLRSLPWLAFFNAPLKKAVVVSSNISHQVPGDVIDIQFNRHSAPAIIIGGPPNSGKSVLANTLRMGLVAKRPEIKLYLHRANWDGEGNHTYETSDVELAKRLKQENNLKIHYKPNSEELLKEYFEYQAQVTQNIRDCVDLALVDVGGKPETVKLPVVKQCTHYLVISNKPEQVQEWHKLFQGLTPLAVIHSVLENRLEVLQTQPYLEMIAGKWERYEMSDAPEVLLTEVLKVLS
jgi:CRISPR-associated protein Csx3